MAIKRYKAEQIVTLLRQIEVGDRARQAHTASRRRGDSRNLSKRMERETGIEPATSSLGSWRSTAELLPLSYRNRNKLV